MKDGEWSAGVEVQVEGGKVLNSERQGRDPPVSERVRGVCVQVGEGARVERCGGVWWAVPCEQWRQCK